MSVSLRLQQEQCTADDACRETASYARGRAIPRRFVRLRSGTIQAGSSAPREYMDAEAGSAIGPELCMLPTGGAD